MKIVRGLVLEVKSKHLILLTPDGDYQKVPHPGGVIKRGDEITCRSSVRIWPKTFAAAALVAAAALILITILPLGIQDGGFIGNDDSVDPVYGYLIFDINPSFELVYNQDLEVTAMQPLNEDAVLLLQGLELNGKLYDTLEWLLERSVSLGYLDSDQEQNFIFISLIQPGEIEVVPELLADFIEENLSYLGISGSVGIFETDKQAHEKAAAAGISINRYLLLEALGEHHGEEISLDDQNLGELIRGLEGREIASLVISTFRPELPPQVPVDSNGLPGGGVLPVDKPGKPDIPDKQGKPGKADDEKGLDVLPGRPDFVPQVPSGDNEGSGPPDSVPVFSN